MQVTATMDFSGFEAFQQHLLEVIERESIPTVAEEHLNAIKGLTDEGAASSGEIFHEYGPSQKRKREKAGLPTDEKTLSFTGGMLASLELRGDTLTVGEGYQKIASGQMSGGGGKWPYQHHFLDASRDTNEIAAEKLATKIRGEL